MKTNRERPAKGSLRRSLGEIWKSEPQSLAMAFGLGALEALIPLLASLLSSLFVDGLEAGRAFGELAALALTGAALLFLLNAAMGKLNRCGLPHTEHCNDLVEWKFCEKNMKMDYAHAEGPEAAALRSKIENDYNWGCGAYFMIPQFQRCCAGVVGSVCALALLLPVFAQGNVWLHWSTPVFAALVAGAVFCSVRSEARTGRKREELKNRFDAKTSRANYLMNRGVTYREGKDIRIYGAQPMIRRALRESEQNRIAAAESRLDCRAGILDGALSGLLLGGAYLFIVLRALDGALTAGSVVLFAAAVYRFSESLKTLSKSWNEIRMNARRMESSFDWLALPDTMENGGEPVSPEDARSVIELRGVSYSYPGTSTPALSAVSLRIEQGEFLCVLGGNGSGKSTLAKHLNALFIPDEGRVTVDGHDTADPSYTYLIRSTVGMVFQNPDDQLVASLIENDVAFGPENLGVPTEQLRQRVTDSLAEVGLMGFERKETTALSGGQKQRVAIAGVLAMEPRVLVLDEASSMLDPRGRKGLMRVCQELHEAGMTIVMITHDMDIVAAHANRVVVMEHGAILADGTPREVFAEKEKLARAFVARPQIVELSDRLGAQRPALTADELTSALLREEGAQHG